MNAVAENRALQKRPPALRPPRRGSGALIALAFALLLATVAAAAGPTIDEPGKLRLQQLFGARVLSGPFVLDVQATVDSSILIATSNIGNVGPAGASVAKLTPGLAPDAGFGGDGVIGPEELGAADSQQSSASALAVLDDGRILVAGMTGRPPAKPQLYVSRLLEDGALDPSFGDGGVRLLDPAASREQTRRDALALQPDGGIVLGFDIRGEDGRQIGLTRLSADGEIDQSFGEAGATLIPSKVLKPDLVGRDLPGYSSDATYGYDVAADSEGRLAVVSSARVKNRRLFAHVPAVVRLGTDGDLRKRGTTVLDRHPRSKRPGDWTLYATTVEFDALDRIVVGGGAGFAPDKGSRGRAFFAFHRLKATGRADKTFGERGQSFVRVRPGDFETGAADLAFMGGKIIAVGQYAGENPAGLLGSTGLVRLRRNGRADRGFGDLGVFLLRPNQDDGRAVAIDPQMRIIAAGAGRLTRLSSS